jgi:hypothetical protein
MATTNADVQAPVATAKNNGKKGPPLPPGWTYGQTSSVAKYPGNNFNQYYVFPALKTDGK